MQERRRTVPIVNVSKSRADVGRGMAESFFAFLEIAVCGIGVAWNKFIERETPNERAVFYKKPLVLFPELANMRFKVSAD